MTPTAEQEFITLWQQGLSHDAMAARLGCPVGTIKSRAHRLQQLGLIQPRPRGGTRTLPTTVHPGTPVPGDTKDHPGTPSVSNQQPTRVH